MPWQFEYVDVENAVGFINIEVRFSELDGEGNTIRSVLRGYSFKKEDCPSRAEMDKRLIADAIKLSGAAGRVSEIISSVGSSRPLHETALQTEPADISQVDKRLIAIKSQLKPKIIEYIHANPNCTLDEMIPWIASGIQINQDVVAAMIRVVCYVYALVAEKAGLIPVNTFEALRDFVASKTTEELISI